MTAVKTHKRRPVAPSKLTQIVTLETLHTLHAETTIEAYHTLFMNIELLMKAMHDHGVQDEVITIINSARLAQYARDIGDLDKYLAEVIAAAKRFNAENDKLSRRAEAQQRYSPEATVDRANAHKNPIKLTPPEEGIILTLAVTARIANNIAPSNISVLKAEQIYGAFWSLKAKCFVVRRNVNAHEAFLAMMKARPKLARRAYRMLVEYRLVQSIYRNVDIYMLVDLPKLHALRGTKIVELGLATREEAQQIDHEEQLPIIEKAKLIVSRLPRVVGTDSRSYMVNRLVELFLLEDKKLRLRLAYYGKHGEPKIATPAEIILKQRRNIIAQNLADTIQVPVRDVIRALNSKNFSSYMGTFLRMYGRDGWVDACRQVLEWKALKKIGDE